MASDILMTFSAFTPAMLCSMCLPHSFVQKLPGNKAVQSGQTFLMSKTLALWCKSGKDLAEDKMECIIETCSVKYWTLMLKCLGWIQTRWIMGRLLKNGWLSAGMVVFNNASCQARHHHRHKPMFYAYSECWRNISRKYCDYAQCIMAKAMQVNGFH